MTYRLTLGLLAALLYLGLVVPAYANSTLERYCQDLAQMVESAAILRESGDTRLHQERRFGLYLNERNEGMFHLALDWAYRFPRYPPQETANIAYDECRQILLTFD